MMINTAIKTLIFSIACLLLTKGMAQDKVRFSKAEKALNKHNIYIVKNQKDIDAFLNRNNFNDLEILEVRQSNDELIAKLVELKDIKELTLQKLDLEYVPDVIYELVGLKFLSLQQNPIKIMPKGICALKNLNELVLWDTEIHRFPGCIEELPLRRVDLYGVQMNYDDQFAIRELMFNVNVEMIAPCDCEFDD